MKKSRKKNHYFTSVTEGAIVDYCNTDCLSKRTQLYAEHIQPAFNELVDKIVYTYKFNSLENIDVLKEDCKISFNNFSRSMSQPLGIATLPNIKDCSDNTFFSIPLECISYANEFVKFQPVVLSA